MLMVDAAATGYSQAPILYCQIPKKGCRTTGESSENHKNHCGAGNPASKQKQVTKEETNVFDLSKRKRMQNMNFL